MKSDAEIEKYNTVETRRTYAFMKLNQKIERLEEEIKQLRAALEDIARQPEGDEQSAQAVAREALKTIKEV